jgi:hypothetical protein
MQHLPALSNLSIYKQPSIVSAIQTERQLPRPSCPSRLGNPKTANRSLRRSTPSSPSTCAVSPASPCASPFPIRQFESNLSIVESYTEHCPECADSPGLPAPSTTPRYFPIGQFGSRVSIVGESPGSRLVNCVCSLETLHD